MKKWLILLVLLIVAAGLIFWLMGREDAGEPETPETPQEPEETEVPEEVLTAAPFTGMQGDGPYDSRAVMAVINNHPAARPLGGQLHGREGGHLHEGKEGRLHECNGRHVE